jgi:putative hydrolase of HD superfamily
MIKESLEKQLIFLLEIDKLKLILRRSKLFDNSRYENDAEHSWHISMMAIVLSEYANEAIDTLKVLKMLLIHDLVEIDAGDSFLYGENIDEKFKNEELAAKRIFGMLPDDQSKEFIVLWEEFENNHTAEAKFAVALDRLEPIMQNYYTQGHAWKKHRIPPEKVIDVNKKIENGSKVLWEYAFNLINESIKKGYFNENYK